MGVWGFYQYPDEPPSPPDWEIFDYIADLDSRDAFIEREMSYEESLGAYEEIATDEGGWGVESAWD